MNLTQNTGAMRINIDNIETTCTELDIVNELLDMDGKVMLELGCGAAEMTRAIASEGRNRQIIATEVDEIQLSKNRLIDDLPNVEFIYAGAEQIPLEDESVDIILLFKSLHHVPIDLMDKSFTEMHRVLKPGGLVYVSEPVFAGSFNEILRLFHDEQAVREAAFNAINVAIEDGRYTLVTEQFFNTTIRFEDFDDFDNQFIQATHTNHRLSTEKYKAVERKFQETMDTSGGQLTMPMRVDLLKKNKPCTQ
jgi:SAM-dependent methyltransferase